jgi:hypothetical protein
MRFKTNALPPSTSFQARRWRSIILPLSSSQEDSLQDQRLRAEGLCFHSADSTGRAHELGVIDDGNNTHTRSGHGLGSAIFALEATSYPVLNSGIGRPGSCLDVKQAWSKARRQEGNSPSDADFLAFKDAVSFAHDLQRAIRSSSDT